MNTGFYKELNKPFEVPAIIFPIVWSILYLLMAISAYIISNKEFQSQDEELYEVLSNYKIDLIVLAGYLKMIGPKLLNKYTIINTHPSLLPKYGGKGMYGMKVHKAVVEAGETVSGVTLHYVNSEYDKGSVIAQTKVDVLPTDTAEDVSAKVQAVEKIQLVNELKKFSLKFRKI